jgi:ribose transport system ATP-binding protein
MPHPVIELAGVGKSFGDGFALENVCLTLYPGEVHVVVGENGSGKSAVMKLLGGLYGPDAGEILLEGKPVAFADIADAKARGVLYRHQEPMLFENLSVAENLFFDLLPRGRFGGLDTVRLRAKAAALLEELGVRLDAGVAVAALGFAQRLLLEAAKACVGTWKVVAFDEPTAAMAEPEREILFSIVRRLKERGVGVFYVSHRLDEILKVGDRVSVVRQGKVLDTRAVDSLDRESLVRMMTGRLQTERYPRVERKRGKPVLEVRGLESRPALLGISFTMRKGELLGVTGLMGSGRTRLAQCLFGAVAPTGGEILLNGKPVRFRDPGDALASGIALVPEDRGENAILHRQDLVLNITVASLSRFRSRAGLDSGFMSDLTKEYSERLGVKPGKPGDHPDHYSGGNQQKVAVARWLARRARIYILDEPTRGIDVASKVDIYNAIGDLVAKGASVILISSDIEEILGLSDRVLVLAGGRIACDLPRAEASQERILEFATAEA